MHYFTMKINPKMMRNRFLERKIFTFGGSSGHEFFSILSKYYQISNKSEGIGWKHCEKTALFYSLYRKN